MKLFHEIEGGAAVLFCRGVYKQTKIYRRGTDIYAAARGGFVKLVGGSGTTVPIVSYYEVEGEGVVRDGQRAPKWAGEDHE